MSVTKVLKIDEVIEAIMTEPLKVGNWIADLDGVLFTRAIDDKPSKELECTVCAVGGMLRSCFNMTPDQIYNTAYQNARKCSLIDDEHDRADYVIDELLDKKDYWSALSCFFESKSEFGVAHARDDERYKLVEFIYAFFPDEIEVQV